MKGKNEEKLDFSHKILPNTLFIVAPLANDSLLPNQLNLFFNILLRFRKRKLSP
jgi:hypothetical protein